MANEMCRTCLNNGVLTDIFQKRDSLMISTTLMSIANIQILPDDGLPTTICLKCLRKLKNCIDFINLCETSDSKLRSRLLEKRKDDNDCLADCDSIKDEDLSHNDMEFSDKIKSENIICEPESKNYDFIDRNVSTPVNCDNSSNIKDEEVETDEGCNKIKVKNRKNKNKDNNKLQCSSCGVFVSTMERIKYHLKMHAGERPHKCSYCNKSFASTSYLKTHIRCHTGEKPLVCKVCGARYASYSALSVHKRCHSNVKRFQCNLCPRSFHTTGHMQYHMLQHTGERKFTCDICGRTFRTRGDVQNHIIAHSEDPKPFVCSVCGLRFTRLWNLQRHIQQQHSGDKSVDMNKEQCMKNELTKSSKRKQMKLNQK